MNLQTIETGDGGDKELTEEKVFEKYFNDSDLFELFKFNPSDECETYSLIREKDGFEFEKTPTNLKHVEFLQSLPTVKGISLNSNLYSKDEEESVKR